MREAVLADAEIGVAPAAPLGHGAAHDGVGLRLEGVRGRRIAQEGDEIDRGCNQDLAGHRRGEGGPAGASRTAAGATSPAPAAKNV